jgi:hypothetical protein
MSQKQNLVYSARSSLGEFSGMNQCNNALSEEVKEVKWTSATVLATYARSIDDRSHRDFHEVHSGPQVLGIAIYGG